MSIFRAEPSKAWSSIIWDQWSWDGSSRCGPWDARSTSQCFLKRLFLICVNLVGIMFINSYTVNSNFFMTRELFAFICFWLGAGLLQRIEMEMMALQVFHNWRGPQQQPTQKGCVCFYGKKISLESCLYFVEKINWGFDHREVFNLDFFLKFFFGVIYVGYNWSMVCKTSGDIF